MFLTWLLFVYFFWSKSLFSCLGSTGGKGDVSPRQRLSRRGEGQGQEGVISEPSGEDPEGKCYPLPRVLDHPRLYLPHPQPRSAAAGSNEKLYCSRCRSVLLVDSWVHKSAGFAQSERSLSPFTEALSECQHPSITHLNWTFTTKRLDTLLCYETISRLTLHNNRFC